MAITNRNAGKVWTSKEKQLIRTLAKGNTPTRVIGIKIGRTPEAIQTMASKIKVSLKPTNQRPYGKK